MRLWENEERFYLVESIDEAQRRVAGLDEAMACVDCDPQTYKLFSDAGDLVWERPGYRVP